MLEADVLTTFIKPMTAVRSLGKMTAARNAERGATSMDWVHARRTRKSIAKWTLSGIGIRASAIADGKWVKTIV